MPDRPNRSLAAETIAELVVYLPSAKALTFKNVEIAVDDVNLFVFTYKSQRDGSARVAKFYVANIVGWARTN